MSDGWISTRKKPSSKSEKKRFEVKDEIDEIRFSPIKSPETRKREREMEKDNISKYKNTITVAKPKKRCKEDDNMKEKEAEEIEESPKIKNNFINLILSEESEELIDLPKTININPTSNKKKEKNTNLLEKIFNSEEEEKEESIELKISSKNKNKESTKRISQSKISETANSQNYSSQSKKTNYTPNNFEMKENKKRTESNKSGVIVSILDDSEESSVEFNLSNKKQIIKPKCKYGAECYRKNKDHLENYDHPINTLPPSSTHQSGNSKNKKIENNEKRDDQQKKKLKEKKTSSTSKKESNANSGKTISFLFKENKKLNPSAPSTSSSSPSVPSFKFNVNKNSAINNNSQNFTKNVSPIITNNSFSNNSSGSQNSQDKKIKFQKNDSKKNNFFSTSSPSLINNITNTPPSSMKVPTKKVVNKNSFEIQNNKKNTLASSSPSASLINSKYSLWNDKYEPRCVIDLAIHSKKIKEVKEWMQNAFLYTKYCKSSHPVIVDHQLVPSNKMLCLTGPSGLFSL